MQGNEMDESKTNKEELEAVFLYNGILEAYEAVGIELIGPNVLEEHVLPRMVYYVREFLPEIFSEKGDSDKLISELKSFMSRLKKKVERTSEERAAQAFTMEEIWELRAAIFGYESVFINILGDTAIKNYVFKRLADILSAYLPAAFIGEKVPLKDKLDAYTKYIQEKKFVKYARATVTEDNKVKVVANGCAFAKIHDSDAYLKANTRFCPWGMIGSAILTSHENRETSIDSCMFTTRGSISDISAKVEKKKKRK
ncbi:MAG: hypothetical protein WED07_13320 [Candidatus Freyarchaeum deiterrae]